MHFTEIEKPRPDGAKENTMNANTPKLTIVNATAHHTLSRRSSRVYIHLGEYPRTPMQMLFERHTHSWRDYRKQILPLLADIFPELVKTKFTWNKYAGCSCPCSPGFKGDDRSGADYHITIAYADDQAQQENLFPQNLDALS